MQFFYLQISLTYLIFFSSINIIKFLVLMNIFMNRHVFSVDKFEKLATGWNIRVKDNGDDKIFFIDRRYYTGKLPPKFTFPWHKWKIALVMVDDFIISAKLDDISLFKIEPENYPDEVQKRLQQGEELMARVQQQWDQTDNKIKELLTEYVRQTDINKQLESECSKLHICWRAPLKLWLLKGKKDEDYLRRLALMYNLFTIADRIYRRYTDTQEDFSVAWARLQFSCRTELWINPHLSFETIIEAHESNKTSIPSKERFALFFEIDELMETSLPPIKDKLLHDYLNFIIRQILSVYAEDYATLDLNYARDGWYKRTSTDEQDYLRNYQKMKLPNYDSFILSPQISAETAKQFFQFYSYSLR